jgi:hypothetical protein
MIISLFQVQADSCLYFVCSTPTNFSFFVCDSNGSQTKKPMWYEKGPEHPAMITKHFAVNCGKVEIRHLLYVPECSLANLLTCPEVITDLKGRRMQDINDINKYVAIK